MKRYLFTTPNFPKNHHTRSIIAVAIIVAFGLVGAFLITPSRADRPYISTEAESGTLTGTATTQLSSNASSGGYVQFNASQIVTSPITNVPAGLTLGYGYESKFLAMDKADQNAAMALMKTDGVQWLRIDLYNVSGYSTIVKDAIAEGIKVDAILQLSTKTTTATPAASAAFATQAVDYYKPLGVETYEVQNEPNGCEDVMDAATYTAILKASYTAVKAADPHAFVITGGLCPAAGSNEPYTYLAAMYADGAHGYFDAFNMHPYSYPDTPNQTTDSWNPWAYLPELHSIMASNGDGNKQIWLTEFGCPTDSGTNHCTDATAAQQITDAFTDARSYSWIGPLLTFNWQDDIDGDFGLYTSSGAAKPLVLQAYMTAAQSR